MIDCGEAVRRMWVYLEHALEASPNAEFEDHVEACQRCCGELEFSRHLRGLIANDHGGPGMPPEVRARIEIMLEHGDRQAKGSR